MPIVDHTSNTIECLAQVVAHLQQAIMLLEEVAPGVLENLDPKLAATLSQRSSAQNLSVASFGDGPVRHPITNRATFCVHWANQVCHLGNTMAFKLLERIARRPDQYVHCDVLLGELWDCHTSRDAVRSAVKVLRRKLNAAGMGDLAEAIDGSTSHHYVLRLNGQW